MLNPLSEVSQQGELVVGVWVHEPDLLTTGSACVADLAAAFAADTAVIPGGQPQVFQGASGAYFVGMSFRVPLQSASKVYDDILKPLSLIPVSVADYVTGKGLVLAFVDYGNGITDANTLASQVASADSGSSLTDQMSWLSAFDAVGALTPYVQSLYAGQVSAQQTERAVVGQTADTLQKAGQKVKDLSLATSGGIVLLVVGALLLAKLLEGAGSELVAGGA